MTLDETWQQIDSLIQTKKYARAQAEQLRECLVSLVVTPEGREVLKRKLPASKHKKSKKLLAGLDEALDGPMPSWEATSPRERHDLLRALLEAIPPSETTHWNLLLRLLREQYTWTGALIIESLKKIKPKGDDLPQKLAGKSGWSGLPHAQGVELLEAALAQALHDPEWRTRLERAVEWARHSPTEHSDGQLPQVLQPSAEESARGAALPPKVQGTHSERESHHAPRVAIGADGLPGCLEQVNRLIEGLYTHLSDRVHRLEHDLEARGTECEMLRSSLARQREEFTDLQQDLERARGSADGLLRKVIELEEILAYVWGGGPLRGRDACGDLAYFPRL